MASILKPRAWVTGANGLIGFNLLRSAAQFAPGYDVRGLVREQVDLTDFPAVRRLFQAQSPQLIIHCAAISKSAECDAQPAWARRVNVEVPARLSELAANIPLVFFSSDLVFDGTQASYDETAAPNPLNLYGETKRAAEEIVLRNPRHIVVRTSLNGGVSPTGDRGFNQPMRQAWREGKTLTLFTDEYRCPIAASLTARAVWELVGNPDAAPARPAGLFHLAGRQCLSRWEIGQCLAARCPELNPRLIPESLRGYSGPPRPAVLRLNCAKLQARLSFPLLGLKEWLEQNPGEAF